MRVHVAGRHCAARAGCGRPAAGRPGAAQWRNLRACPRICADAARARRRVWPPRLRCVSRGGERVVAAGQPVGAGCVLVASSLMLVDELLHTGAVQRRATRWR